VDIVRFVPTEQVDPIYFDRTYYLAPAGPEAQRRPYVLLLRAMQDAGMAAVGKFVLWGKENLCLIRPLGESLVLETLYFAEDIRPRAEIDEAVEETDVKDPELAMARQLVESLVGDFDPEDYENDYRNELRAMLEAKLAGQEIARPEPAPEAPVIDLMDALKQSVAQAQQDKGKPAAGKPKKKASTGRKRAAAR
jgi:DNA end-binding protein Ku